MSKKPGSKYSSQFSYFLEERIDVPFQIVGYPEWLEEYVPSTLKSDQIPIRVNKEDHDLVPVLTALWKERELGLDLETGGEKELDGLDPISTTSEVLLAQFGNTQKIFVVQPELISHFREPLESDKILKINQNIEFDFKFFKSKYDIDIVRMYCTMLAEQVLRAGKSGFGVSLLDLVRYHAYRVISKEVRSQFIGHKGRFTEEQLYYAARDIFLLFQVFPSQSREIKKYKLANVCKDEFSIIPAVAEMELVGVYMDKRYLALSMEYHSRELGRLRQAIKDEFNSELRRLGKSDASAEFFQELLGIEEESEEDFDLDSTGQKLVALRRIGVELDNVQRATLKTLENKIAKLLVAYSFEQKMCSTYGQRLIDMIHPADNRLHPRWKQMGMGDADSHGSRDQATTIATGRMSGDFQQLPRPKEIYDKVVDLDEMAAVRQVFKDQIVAAQKELNEVLIQEKAA